jgi:hypothetical protein
VIAALIVAEIVPLIEARLKDPAGRDPGALAAGGFDDALPG